MGRVADPRAWKRRSRCRRPGRCSRSCDRPPPPAVPARRGDRGGGRKVPGQRARRLGKLAAHARYEIVQIRRFVQFLAQFDSRLVRAAACRTALPDRGSSGALEPEGCVDLRPIKYMPQQRMIRGSASDDRNRRWGRSVRPTRSMTARERWLPTVVKDTISGRPRTVKPKPMRHARSLGRIAMAPMLDRQGASRLRRTA